MISHPARESFPSTDLVIFEATADTTSDTFTVPESYYREGQSMRKEKRKRGVNGDDQLREIYVHTNCINGTEDLHK